MIRPKPLKKGDKVALIGTSSPVIEERIKPSIEFLESLGFKVVLGESCLKCHGYLSGTDEMRAHDLNIMFKDKSIKGIFIIRGGYGCNRILNLLDYDLIKYNPKILAGYSDVTALHIVLNQKCNLITFHTPMAATEFYKGVDDYTLNCFKKNIFNKKSLGNIKDINEVNELKCLVPGCAEGEITGGNLSVITSLMGTPYEIDTKGKILFLEDVDEYPYKIDKMITQLKLADKFKDAAGIILGAWTNCNKPSDKESLTLDEIFNELIKDENKPTIYDLTCGHCLPTFSFPMGSRVKINSNEKTIIFK